MPASLLDFVFGDEILGVCARTAVEHRASAPTVPLGQLRSYSERLALLAAPAERDFEPWNRASDGETYSQYLKRLHPHLPPEVRRDFRILRRLGNAAAHADMKAMTDTNVQRAFDAAQSLGLWFSQSVPTRATQNEPKTRPATKDQNERAAVSVTGDNTPGGASGPHTIPSHADRARSHFKVNVKHRQGTDMVPDFVCRTKPQAVAGWIFAATLQLSERDRAVVDRYDLWDSVLLTHRGNQVAMTSALNTVASSYSIKDFCHGVTWEGISAVEMQSLEELLLIDALWPLLELSSRVTD